MIGRRRAEAGVVSVEFAMLAGLLVLLFLGTLSVGLLILSQTALQSVSAQTARCVALGSSLCPSAPQYAVQLARQRLFPGVITAADVTVSQATSCNGATGQYTTVTIASTYWSGLFPSALNGVSLTAQACYPSHS
jgi:Flp pilus assembly protein TadG